MLNYKTILITGGTGSLGQALTSTILKKYKNINKLIIFSRDELKQFEMSQTINTKLHKGIRYFLGDVRDSDRLRRGLEDVDYVIHAAALKQVPAAEYNPFEFIKTNVIEIEHVWIEIWNILDEILKVGILEVELEVVEADIIGAIVKLI